MEHLERASIILTLADNLRKNGSWTGETHIQKAGYFLQQLLNVPTDLRYILYKHGPFSFELRDLLTYMQAEDFIKWVPQPPYGPSLQQGGLSEELELQFGSKSQQFKTQIEFVAERLGRKTVAELERLATALYVTQEEGLSGAYRANRIVQLKPHVSFDQAELAVKELDKIIESATSSDLVVH
jgi:hypothetical protein